MFVTGYFRRGKVLAVFAGSVPASRRRKEDAEMRSLVARTALGVMLLALLPGGVGPTCADFIVLTGRDPGAEPDQPHPNSDAAAARFDGVAGMFGAINLIDFESAPLGDFSSLRIAPGLTATKPSEGG